MLPHQHNDAEDRPDSYWLYAVTNCNAAPALQDPIKDSGRFPWHEVRKVAATGWRWMRSRSRWMYANPSRRMQALGSSPRFGEVIEGGPYDNEGCSYARDLQAVLVLLGWTAQMGQVEPARPAGLTIVANPDDQDALRLEVAFKKLNLQVQRRERLAPSDSRWVTDGIEGEEGDEAGRMIPKECKRLAEVDFPIAVVSKHAAKEKSIRHGHPSTLHLWWARRPLASCRAMLLALLLPDPCDEHCPEDFKTQARALLPSIQREVGPTDHDLQSAKDLSGAGIR